MLKPSAEIAEMVSILEGEAKLLSSLHPNLSKALQVYVAACCLPPPLSNPQRRFRILSQSKDTHQLAVCLREAAEKVELLAATKQAAERQLAKRPRTK